jgi:hypothetical protein
MRDGATHFPRPPGKLWLGVWKNCSIRISCALALCGCAAACRDCITADANCPAGMYHLLHFQLKAVFMVGLCAVIDSRDQPRGPARMQKEARAITVMKLNCLFYSALRFANKKGTFIITSQNSKATGHCGKLIL